MKTIIFFFCIIIFKMLIDCIKIFGDVRTVDVTVRRLREKIEDNPSHPEWIVTRRGVGYYLRNPEQES